MGVYTVRPASALAEAYDRGEKFYRYRRNPVLHFHGWETRLEKYIRCLVERTLRRPQRDSIR